MVRVLRRCSPKQAMEPPDYESLAFLRFGMRLPRISAALRSEAATHAA